MHNCRQTSVVGRLRACFAAATKMLLLLLAVHAALAGEPAVPAAKPASNQRIVFIGDSITDGFTYPLLIRQAIAEAGRPVPTCIDAGVASDTARLMRKRVERDVLPASADLGDTERGRQRRARQGAARRFRNRRAGDCRRAGGARTFLWSS